MSLKNLCPQCLMLAKERVHLVGLQAQVKAQHYNNHVDVRL